MAWNRPSESGEANSCSLQKRSGDRFPVRGAIAGTIVVVGAAVAALWLWPEGERAGETPAPRNARRIKEVASATNAVVRAEKVPTATNDVESDTFLWTGKGPKPPKRPVFGPDVMVVKGSHRKKTLEEQTFRYGSEIKIASLLTMEVGEPLFGDSADMFNASFLRSLERSLKTPIVIEPTDSEEVKALKKAVRETKTDLVCRMKAGEDICQTLIRTRNELQQLGAYREDLRKMVNRELAAVRDDEAAANDVIAAANKMLTDRGIKEIAMPTIYRRRFELKKVQQGEGSGK